MLDLAPHKSNSCLHPFGCAQQLRIARPHLSNPKLLDETRSLELTPSRSDDARIEDIPAKGAIGVPMAVFVFNYATILVAVDTPYCPGARAMEANLI
jgi:hypothetical protein